MADDAGKSIILADPGNPVIRRISFLFSIGNLLQLPVPRRSRDEDLR